MPTAFALLALLLGSESWREREAADRILRWARPYSDTALLSAIRSPNPEISRRASAALIGEAHFAPDKLLVGFRFQYGQYIAEIRRCDRQDTFMIEAVTHRGRTLAFVLSRAEIEKCLREQSKH